MREANITRAPNRRSEAEIRRSMGPKTPQRAKEDKGERETFHALKMQRVLSPVSYGHRNAVKAKIQEVDTFDQFNLLPIIKESIGPQALGGMSEIVPSAIQRLAIPTFLGQELTRKRRPMYPVDSKPTMEQFLIAAETGSGKTLAYLLPILDAMKRAEAIDDEEEVRRRAEIEKRTRTDPTYVEPPPLNDIRNVSTGRPRAIILVPTAELVAQVCAVAKSLSHTIKFRTAALSSNLSPKVIRNRLFSDTGVDLVISTPHLLSSIAEAEGNVLSRVSHLVIDEADSLLDRSFTPATTAIIDRATPSLRQLILCSATIPRTLDTYLRTRFPNLVRLVTPNLHAIPRRVQLGVVDVEKEPYRGNKLLACADTIWMIGKNDTNETDSADVPHAPTESMALKRLLVFVNERETTTEVAEYLRSKGIDAAALTRDTPERQLATLLAPFTVQPTQPGVTQFPTHAASSVASHNTHNYSSASPAKRTLPNVKVLVTTDLGSRGIDTLAVRHVILYDVPHSTIDFIHRLGRTGRMGRRGRGIVLVGKGDRRDVVREVREGMFRGQALI